MFLYRGNSYEKLLASKNERSTNIIDIRHWKLWKKNTSKENGKNEDSRRMIYEYEIVPNRYYNDHYDASYVLYCRHHCLLLVYSQHR